MYALVVIRIYTIWWEKENVWVSVRKEPIKHCILNKMLVYPVPMAVNNAKIIQFANDATKSMYCIKINV